MENIYGTSEGGPTLVILSFSDSHAVTSSCSNWTSFMVLFGLFIVAVTSGLDLRDFTR